jgi:hypothetical protein
MMLSNKVVIRVIDALQPNSRLIYGIEPNKLHDFTPLSMMDGVATQHSNITASSR